MEEREELVGLMSEMAEAKIADVTAEAEMAEADRGRRRRSTSMAPGPAPRPLGRSPAKRETHTG